MQSFLFVYGTLRRCANHPMHQLLEQTSRFIGMAHFQGKLYQVTHYPAVVASANPDEQVLGEVYQLLQPEQTLPQLDKYEECGADFPEPQEYRRELQPVRLENGDSLTAWVYLYNRDTRMLTPIPSGDFLSQSN
ncbi:MAG TPA: gamma-glutamylcyclotransferase family protein [Rheinheimera sp.]|nr:gamma-glutamylcyclotransferase family protein [Rheinheimera sp.]